MAPKSSLRNKDDEEEYARGAPPLSPETNIGAIMDYMMTIPSKEEFDRMFDRVVIWALANTPDLKTKEQAIARVKKNLLYWSGYAIRWRTRIGKYLHGQ